MADDILKNVEFDALRLVFNKFQSVVSFLPTTATILSPEVTSISWLLKFLIVFVAVSSYTSVLQAVEKEAESGGKLGELDSYEIEGAESKSEILQNLSEFQFSCVCISLINYCSYSNISL